MIVRLRSRETRFPDLTPNQAYVVIGIEADDFRILNDQGRPYLYAADAFEIVDPRERGDWVSETGEDGERYDYPARLNGVGFFEDFFDDQAEAVRAFWREVNGRLAHSAAA